MKLKSQIFQKKSSHIVLWITMLRSCFSKTLLLRSGHVFLNQRNTEPKYGGSFKKEAAEKRIFPRKDGGFFIQVNESRKTRRERERLFSRDFSIVFEPSEIKSERIK
ncbi:hypothetical protein CDAR_437141 [Caerostris darwini]|uniref:Uncharacterized protein n=1 Tax=Caerostris darwini TaxID=1538125 RepID=A0AAV4TW24_9ARAC|nr:hypothetical protein CDAR_437141 [Caerostris darwini]